MHYLLIKRSFLFQMLLLRKEGLPCFRVLKNKFEEDNYELYLLILITFVKTPRIIFKVLNFVFIIS
jgi:hypothetical protein